MIKDIENILPSKLNNLIKAELQIPHKWMENMGHEKAPIGLYWWEYIKRVDKCAVSAWKSGGKRNFI